MTKLPANFVDTHVHLDLVVSGAPDRIDWYRQVRCLPISWAFGRHIASVSDLKASLMNHKETVYAIRKAGLNCYYLTGVHPRNIPPDLASEKVEKILAPFLDDPVCLGIGEIGLEFAHQQEKEILVAQLEMAQHACMRNKIFGVHTPRGDKARVTREVLEVLKEFKAWGRRIVVDHCMPDTIGDVLKQGFWAGITLSPGKASFADLDQMVKDHPDSIDRLMLNTDSGSRFNEDLYRYYHTNTFPEDIQAKLFKENALNFFGIET